MNVHLLGAICGALVVLAGEARAELAVNQALEQSKRTGRPIFALAGSDT